MRKKFELSTEEYLAIQARMKENRDKRIDKRLQVLILRHEGKTPKEIIEKLNLSRSWIMQLCKDYREKGLEEYCHLKYDGHHRSLSEAEEDEILATFQEKANAGQIVTVKEIKAAFDAKIGKDTGRGYIYMLLKRKGWRKTMPRSKHPKRASEEAIEASKKLTKK